MSRHHKKWSPIDRLKDTYLKLPEGWEQMPVTAAYCKPGTGEVILCGYPDSEGGELHSCDEMGCGSVGLHVLARCQLTSPDLE